MWSVSTWTNTRVWLLTNIEKFSISFEGDLHETRSGSFALLKNLDPILRDTSILYPICCFFGVFSFSSLFFSYKFLFFSVLSAFSSFFSFETMSSEHELALRDVSTLNGSSLKLVDKFTYQGSSLSLTETGSNTRLAMAWTATIDYRS